MKIKRKAAFLLAAVLTASSVFTGVPAFAADGENGNTESDPRGALMAGKFISVLSSSPKGANVVVNNNGMSGLESYIHLHDSKPANSFKTDIAGKKGAFTFEFSEIVPIGYMYVWNFNAVGGLDNGIKDAKIQYSINGKNWFDLGSGEYTFARAQESENAQYGGNAANNLADGARTPIDFGGLSAKYVRIIPKSNYGGSGYGLAEVRFFRFKTRPNKGSMISLSARAPKADSAENLSNNYGMSDLTSYSATHSNAPETMWRSDKSAEDSFVVLDMDGTYPVDSLYIWNYNNPDDLSSGVKRVKIEYTTKQPYSISGSTINYAGGEWTSLGEYDVPVGTGSDKMPYSLSVDCKGIQMQYMRIIPLENHGGKGFGLSAVRAFAGKGWAVEPSRDWSQLFSNEGTFDYQTSGTNKNTSTGWLAADGIYTVNMNGADRAGSSDMNTKTTFLFSDTLVGNFLGFKGKASRYGKNMYYQGLKNNTLATLIGNKPDPRNMQFYLTTADSSTSILGDGNWAQELVRVGDSLYAWSFAHIGLSAANFMFNKFALGGKTLPDFATRPAASDADIITEYTENGTKYRIEFSGAVMDNTESGGATPSPDGYIYLYGIKCYQAFLLIKNPIVARVKPEDFSNVSAWRYYDGENWVEDVKKAAIIDGGDGMVSNEFSVSYMENGPFAGKYVMNFTNFTITTSLVLATSDTPYGPFNCSTDKLFIYDCPQKYEILEQNGDNEIYTYNSKAHPNLSADGELLISYNLNSYKFDERTSFEYLHPFFVTLFTVDDATKSAPRTIQNDGENLAKAASATASITKQGSNAANAIDANASTVWESGAKISSDIAHGVEQETELTLDFGKSTAMNKVVLHWGTQAKKAPNGYKIEYSSDKKTWTEADGAYHYGAARSQGSASYSVDTVRFDQVNARYLRVNVLRSAGLNSPSIREIEVYDEQTVSAPEQNAFVPTPNDIGAKGETDTDYSALESKLSEIKAAALQESKYTAESWSAFSTALEAANALMADPNEAEQSTVDAVIADLTKAYSELVLKPTPTPPTPTPTPTPSVPKNGTKVVNGKTVLYQNSKAVTGTKIVTVGGKTYAVVGGYVKTGAKTQLVKIGKKTYVVDKSGVVVKAKANKLIRIGTKTYVLSKNGTIVKPSKNKLVKVGKKSYIVGKSGVVLKNKKSVKVGKKTYKVNKKGVATLAKKK